MRERKIVDRMKEYCHSPTMSATSNQQHEMKTPPMWSPSDLSRAKYVGILEFEDEHGEWHYFEVQQTPERIVFGGSTNNSWLESGYIAREDGESLDETLQELHADLNAWYNIGSHYCSRIVCNERM